MTTIDISTPRRNGTPLKERATVSHVADDPVHSKTQHRAVLPSNSPSSAYSAREKRRQTTSPSPEFTENVNKEAKKRKLNKQSCSYCRKDKEKVKQLFLNFKLADYLSAHRQKETGRARNVTVVERRACPVRSLNPRPATRKGPKPDHLGESAVQAPQVMALVSAMMLLKLCAILLLSSVCLEFETHTLLLPILSASTTLQRNQIYLPIFPQQQ
jgi:hypothetical protein